MAREKDETHAETALHGQGLEVEKAGKSVFVTAEWKPG